MTNANGDEGLAKGGEVVAKGGEGAAKGEAGTTLRSNPGNPRVPDA